MTYDTHGRQDSSPPDPQQSTSDNPATSSTSPPNDGNTEKNVEKLKASFPIQKLRSLTQKISNPRWVVPVLPEQELECLLNTAIELTIAGCDHECEPCMEFYKNGMTTSFTKILTDEAVNSWKNNIHHCILMSCGKLLHLIAIHMKRDNPYLLDLLAMVFDPDNKFHTYNVGRSPECYQQDKIWGMLDENQMYAKSPPDSKTPRGWLVDLINRFGQFGGFDNLLERFNMGVAVLRKPTPHTEEDEHFKITLGLIYAFLRPFGQCYELLTMETIEKYFKPIWEVVLELLSNLSDDVLKREAKPDGRSDCINGIVKSARLLASRLPNQENVIRELEMFRLKMILRLLQVSSFNGKMNALNDINKVLTNVSYYSHRSAQLPHCMPDDEMDWLTAERMAAWIKETNVLGIVLRDSLHQPQYVEKLEKIIRFLIKERALTLEDLDLLWRAQVGKHEAIVKNVHDLLAKLAWDFTPEQLDHLFGCFQASMTTANKRQRERLLEFIRRLAEDDKNGVMAHKTLKLFWSLAHSAEVPQEVLDQALAAHVKILDYSCSQERDAQKTAWLEKCVEELARDNWVLPALRLIREICCLYDSQSISAPRSHQTLIRQQVIERLQNDSSLVILVTNNLTKYMDKIREMVRENPDQQAQTLCIDNRYPHTQQISERLDFLKFLLKDGQLWLCADQAKQIWQCLAVNAIFPSDREECFRWFSKLMGEEPDLDPGINEDFFENNLLQLEPQLLTESGIKCFERFFKAVNSKGEKLKAIHRTYMLENPELIGKDYLWRVITTGGEDIANKAIDLLKEVSTALGPRLQANIRSFHEMFISECIVPLKQYYNTITILSNSIDNEADPESKDIKMRTVEADKMCRIIKVLQEYIKECDRSFNGDRVLLPLNCVSRGKQMNLYVRFQNAGRPIDDIEIPTHTNEMVGAFKRSLLKRIKSSPAGNIKVDLYYTNGELVEISDDIAPLSTYNIRDKSVLTAKLTTVGACLASSPDSSSDSSTVSPPRPCPGVHRPENENALPGVLMSQKHQYTEFFLMLYQMGSDIKHNGLRESVKTLLHLIPSDRQTVRQLVAMCMGRKFTIPSANPGDNCEEPVTVVPPEGMFLHVPPAHVLYNLGVLMGILIPATGIFIPGIEPVSFLTIQSAWLRTGVAQFIVELLTKNNFLPNTDVGTKRYAFQCVLRLTKLFLQIVGYILSRVGDEPVSPGSSNPSSSPDDGSHINPRSQIDILKHALTTTTDMIPKAISTKLSEKIAAEMLSESAEGAACRKQFAAALQWTCPDLSTIKSIIQLTWAASSGNLQLHGTKSDFSEETGMPDALDFAMCKEALEVLTLALMLNPSAGEVLCKDPLWPKFITSIVLRNESIFIRQIASEQLFFCSTYCVADRRPFGFMVQLLVSSLQNLVPNHASTCADYFSLLCRTLNYACAVNWPLNLNEELLTEEIEWLRDVLENVKKTGDIQVHEDLLCGHLCFTKELMNFLAPESKAQLNELILELIDHFLFPASRQYLRLRETGDLGPDYMCPPPVCRTPNTIAAACDLLISLCQGCIPNMKLLTNTLIDMVCRDTEPLREWDYLPPIGQRPLNGFCGLKNAGATCYMNSVLQQLYMVPSIRVGLLKVDGAATDENEDFSGEFESASITSLNSQLVDTGDEEQNRKNYHISILKYVQAIFAHLGHSTLQFYVPRGLWTNFKLQGEPVNLREQQDAVEFFMSLFESLDEGLKALGHPQLMGSTLGGSFSDQKICQQCPHRYSKEEPFSVFSVDIRNHSSLTESLEQYVKGELLEGADAYHCDKCDKKVVTIKRLCVRKLPPVLAIQLKRFEYDYERVCAIKFNDYFEFPRVLDMEPYTVSGLAKIEGEVIEIEENPNEELTTTKYELTGIVVHSGQASGGHYFSYILHKNPETGKEQWYKFDDGEVTECKMHEDEELKVQCFGGEYMGEIYDNNLKRMQYRRQKRWWNAYMLFYTRCDQKPIQPTKACVEQFSLAESRSFVLPMPKPIEKGVRTQNVKFLHSKSIFSTEFFTFIRKLINSSGSKLNEKLTPQSEELSLLGMKLATNFLFHTGFRTKKNLRGSINDWYDSLSNHILHSAVVRRRFAENALLNPPTRLAEYILVAPSPEIRNFFIKLIVFFCHFAINDDPLPHLEGSNLCEQVLLAVIQLLKSEVANYGKHVPNYFSLFNMFCCLGWPEKHQLLVLNIPAIFMQVAIDEGPGPQIKYQYPELTKLHVVVSQLVRCSDISSRCQSSNESDPRIPPNIYREAMIPVESMMPLSPEASELLFNRTTYLKKLIEDVQAGEEGLKLLQYCSWENPMFSRSVLSELLWQCGYAYCQDMRYHTELLLHILLIEDSWQNHRIHNALMGVVDPRDGLLEIIHRSKTHYQKRAYQVIKCLTQLFHKNQIALMMLETNVTIKRSWASAVEWLQDELERTRGIASQYNYSWSPPAQSNDSTNVNKLERSQSAKRILALAIELCPETEEEPEDPNESDAEPNEDSSRVQTSASENSVVLVDSNTSSANNTANLNNSETVQPQTEEEQTTSTTATVTSPTTSTVTSTTTISPEAPFATTKQPLPNSAAIDKFLHPFEIQRKLNGITADIGQMSINQTISTATTSTPTKNNQRITDEKVEPTSTTTPTSTQTTSTTTETTTTKPELLQQFPEQQPN